MLNQNPAIPLRRRTLNFLYLLLFILLQLLIIGIAFAAGFLTSDWQLVSLPSQKEFPILDEAYSLLQKNAVFDLPAKKALEYGMIKGMLTAVNDPYTVFVEPPQHKMETDKLQGHFGGIGVRVERDSQNNVIIYPLPGSPALKAGVQDGDRLLAIGNVPINPQTSSDDIHAAIRGPVGDGIEIVVGRSPDYTPIKLTIQRADVAIPSTTWNLLPDQPGIGIVHIQVIANTTPKEVTTAIKELQQQGAERFILDVRNNGGGLVDAGVNLARLFLKSGQVIDQQYRGQPVKSFTVDNPGEFDNLPMVVLVNKGTASAAEIFAGAIKGQNRAQIVGTRTYGKDTIQLVFNLSDGSSLHVTSAHWWVPNLSTKIGGNGLQPDVAVDEKASDVQQVMAAVNALLKIK